MTLWLPPPPTPPINMNTPKKLTSLVPEEIQKLRKSRSSDSEIIEHLLDTDGLTKLASPKNNDKENNVNYKRQEVMFTATPLSIKQVLQPDSSEPVKPQKQFKRSTNTEKDSGERITLREKRENEIVDLKMSKPVEKKFKRKIKIKNATELFQNFPQERI